MGKQVRRRALVRRVTTLFPDLRYYVVHGGRVPSSTAFGADARAAWSATPLVAEMCAATPAHCQRHMPCCPPSSSGGENCSPVLCPAQTSQRAVQNRTIRATPPLRIAAVPARPALHKSVPVRELTCGMHYSPPVFRLKDDLRI
ncbi:MAG: hypothetical protein WBE76_31855 [Terracidiphilus sp.]